MIKSTKVRSFLFFQDSSYLPLKITKALKKLEWPNFCWDFLFESFYCSRHLIEIQKKDAKNEHYNKFLVLLVLTGLHSIQSSKVNAGADLDCSCVKSSSRCKCRTNHRIFLFLQLFCVVTLVTNKSCSINL